MKQRVVLSIGELLWDMLPDGKRLGGAPVNFAYYVERGGCKAYAVSAIGRDASGDELLAEFNCLGLDSSFIQRNENPTSSVGVSLDSNGVPQYEIYENVAWDNICADEKILALSQTADAICWGSLAQRSEKSRQAILQIIDNSSENTLKIFDINLRQNFYSKEIIENSLVRADVLKLNEDEIVVLAEMFGLSGDIQAKMKSLMDIYSLRYLIFTMGGEGSIIMNNDGEMSHQKPIATKIVDTVGAGDSFTATFIASILNGVDFREAHKMASNMASKVCGHSGAIVKI